MSPGLAIPLLCALGLLVLASIGAHLMRPRVPAGAAAAAVGSPVSRLRAWWVMALLIALASLFGRTGVVLLFALCSFAALREFVPLGEARRADRRTLAVALFTIIPVQYGLLLAGQIGPFSVFIPVYCFLLGPVLSALRSETEGFVIRAAEIQWALMICVFGASHVPALLLPEAGGGGGRGVLLVAFLVVVVQMAEVLQMVCGKLFGRRQVAPRLSPPRTVEGFAGGVLAATVLGGLLFWMTPFTPLQAAGTGFAIAATGLLGGLVVSAIRHDRSESDGGARLEEHGGVSDRLATVFFAAPVLFHLTGFWLT